MRMIPRRPAERPLADEPRVLSYDLVEADEMDADDTWSLGSILARYPADWPGRGLREPARGQL